VLKYLSDAWMDAAAEAVAGDESLAAAAADLDLAVDYEVTGSPFGKRRYQLRFDHGSVELVNPPVGEAQAGFSTDYDTAAQIARGELAVQVAFMQGRLKLEGDVAVLVRDGAALDGLDDALADLRSRTEY
jgi:putative sterol carrier protein